MASSPTFKVFLTHQWKDIGFARQLYSDLGRNGFEVWLDDKALKGGHRLPEEINHGLAWCDVYIPILSKAALASQWCWEEIGSAINLSLAKRSSGKQRPKIVSVLIEDCESILNEQYPSLAARLYIKFYGRPYEESFRELVEKGFGASIEEIERIHRERAKLSEPTPVGEAHSKAVERSDQRSTSPSRFTELSNSVRVLPRRVLPGGVLFAIGAVVLFLGLNGFIPQFGFSGTPTAVALVSPIITATVVVRPTATPSLTATSTLVPSPAATPTRQPTDTPSRTATSLPTPTETPLLTLTPTASPTAVFYILQLKDTLSFHTNAASVEQGSFSYLDKNRFVSISESTLVPEYNARKVKLRLAILPSDYGDGTLIHPDQTPLFSTFDGAQIGMLHWWAWPYAVEYAGIDAVNGSRIDIIFECWVSERILRK